MPCAAGSLCAAIPDHTPGPPLFTIHKYRVCGGYLDGLCGLPDPLGDNEMQRVCHGCVNSNNRNESSADPAAGAASSKRLRPERQETGKEKQAGALDSLKRVGNTAARKARGADTRKRPTFEQQFEALDLLKSVSRTAIAARRNESSADPAAGAASSKRLRPERQETGKEKQAGALDSLNRVGNTAARKARGADTRKRPTFEQQFEALDLLKSVSRTAIAARLNVDSDDDEADSSAGDKDQCTQPVLSPRPPPYTDVARQFGDLEGIAERCSMAGLSYHLRKAKLAWMSEAGSKKTKQTCMADFM